MASTRHPTDGEQQREQLSAYIDGELDATERADLEAHLPGCVECRTALADLRSIHGLLAAMPGPRLPRAFLLPEVGELPPARRAAIPPAPVALHARPVWYRASQWAGAAAASIGLVLLLGSAALGAFSSHQTLASRTDSPFQAGGAQTTNAHAPINAPTATPSPHGQAPNLTDTSKSTTTAPSQTPAPSPTAEPASGTVTDAPNADLALPITGAGLLAGGATLLVAGRLAGRRRA